MAPFKHGGRMEWFYKMANGIVINWGKIVAAVHG